MGAVNNRYTDDNQFRIQYVILNVLIFELNFLNILKYMQMQRENFIQWVLICLHLIMAKP